MEQSMGYLVTIIRKGQAARRLTATGGGDLRTMVYDVARSEESVVSDSDHWELANAVSGARALADIIGFAALNFGEASVTIRPERSS